MENTKFVLEMLNINKAFPGVQALNNAKLQLRPGTVHALMGENGAGKSTLMKCLFGIYVEDSGEILLNGTPVKFNNPRQALDSGVSMVHQELNQVLKRSVMENIWLGRFPTKYGLVDHAKMYTDTKAIFDRLEIDVNPRTKIGTLSVSQRQMVEIAKAVSYNAKILVLDEPTSSLTEKEVEHLFRIIGQLKENKCAIIYISHKMQEILRISDEVTIMRDGNWISTTPAVEVTTDSIINMMVGRKLTDRFPARNNKPEGVLLEVKNLTAMYQPSIKNVSFTVRKGEVLGIAGLVGAKRTELLENIFGIARRSEGEVILNGKQLKCKSSRESIANGLAFLTEERRANGIFAGLNIKFNSVIANLSRYCRFGFVDDKKCTEDTQWIIESMNVKTPSQKTLIRSLSGGNQQKIIIGRWLLTDADVYLLDEPTRGIDVGAKYEIYQLILDLACKGKSVIMVSSEMPELLGICDRILVMSNGLVADICEAEGLTQEEILRLAAKYI